MGGHNTCPQVASAQHPRPSATAHDTFVRSTALRTCAHADALHACARLCRRHCRVEDEGCRPADDNLWCGNGVGPRARGDPTYGEPPPANGPARGPRAAARGVFRRAFAFALDRHMGHAIKAVRILSFNRRLGSPRVFRHGALDGPDVHKHHVDDGDHSFPTRTHHDLLGGNRSRICT